MILADKIINERKKNGWSQEELAQMLSVSRQSVSKWESAQAVPDLNRIIQMAKLFNVSTDYLLKDEIEADTTSAPGEVIDPEYANMKKVSLEDADRYIRTVKNNTPTAIIATVLFVLSPVLLIFLAGYSTFISETFSDTSAALTGLIALFICIAVGVVLWISVDAKEKEFEYIKEEPFETLYGVDGMVREKSNAFAPKKTLLISIAVLCFILSPIGVITGALMGASSFVVICFVCLILVLVAAGVGLSLYVSRIDGSYTSLLEEGRNNIEHKKKNKLLDRLSGSYWCIVVAVFLIFGLSQGKWNWAGVIFPIAGVLYAAIFGIIKAFTNKD